MKERTHGLAHNIQTGEKLSAQERHGKVAPIRIALEGLDGSGKTVQANRLADTLKGQGYRVCVVDFPQYTQFFGQQIGAMLAGTGGVSAMDVDGKSMSLWYAVDRWKTLEQLPMEEYDYVIFNRYTLSNVVYQCARTHGGWNEAFAQWVLELEHTQLHLPEPHLYLYLDTHTDLCGDNVRGKGERDYVEGLDVYEQSGDLLSQCHRIYRQLAVEMEHMVMIPCLQEDGRMKSVEAIHQQVMDVVKEQGLFPL